MTTAEAPARTLAQKTNGQSTMIQELKGPVSIARITSLLPANYPAQKFVAQIITLLRQKPELMECTPESIFRATMRAAMHGLVPDPVLNHAHFVPRYNKHIQAKEITYQLGYRGVQVLAERSGKVHNIRPFVVNERDEFLVQMGTDPKIEHRPCLDPDPGPVVAYYAVAECSYGKEFAVVSRRQVEKHRDQYSQAKEDGPWVTAFDEMALNHVSRKLAKRLPMSSEDMRLIVADEYREAGIDDGMDDDALPSIAVTAAPTEPGKTAAQSTLAAKAAAARKQDTPAATVTTTKAAQIDAEMQAAKEKAAVQTDAPRRQKKAAAVIDQAERITIDQAAQITARIEEHGVPQEEWEELMQKLGAQAVNDVRASDFARVMQWISTGELAP